MATSSENLSVEDVTNTFINTNAAMLDSFVSLVNKVESDLMSISNESLQGETEEILREILQMSNDAIKQIIPLQEMLQVRFVESYFPAQD